MKYRAKPIEVEAFRILRVDKAMGGCPESVTCEVLGKYELPTEMVARIDPEPGDYLVRAPQPDGSTYDYLNPKEVFESKYESVLDSVKEQK